MIRKIQDHPEPEPEIPPEAMRKSVKDLEARGTLHHPEGGIFAPMEKGWKSIMKSSEGKEVIHASGSEKISATDPEIVVISKSSEIEAGTVSVLADKSCVDFSDDIRDALKLAKKIRVLIECDGESDSFEAFGSPALKLSSEHRIVFTKSDVIKSSTSGIMASKSSAEISQALVEKLRNHEANVKITIETI